MYVHVLYKYDGLLAYVLYACYMYNNFNVHHTCTCMYLCSVNDSTIHVYTCTVCEIVNVF